jgi:hypothetical protein
VTTSPLLLETLPPPLSPLLLAPNKRCNHEFRVPGARRTSLHRCTFIYHDNGPRSSRHRC